MLRITEIFYSLQGESTTMGFPTVFIRLTGCPLRCGYCDTEYAFTGGNKMSIDEVLEKVARFAPRYVCVTGGEPLAQKNAWPLMQRLCNAGYHVSIETSGAITLENIDPRVMIVMDLKTPGSGEVSRNLMSNIPLLKKTDQIKFVLTNRDDYLWAKKMIEDHALDTRCQLLFSPSYEQLQPKVLAEWIIEDNLPVRFQMQLHKVIWGEMRGV
ncbi:MAG: 7-carboxy-7-deazaguanine synthase QueE [Gammaproteobacteria bacterium]